MGITTDFYFCAAFFLMCSSRPPSFIISSSAEDLIKSKRVCGRDVDIEDIRLLELPDQDEKKS